MDQQPEQLHQLPGEIRQEADNQEHFEDANSTDGSAELAENAGALALQHVHDDDHETESDEFEEAEEEHAGESDTDNDDDNSGDDDFELADADEGEEEDGQHVPHAQATKQDSQSDPVLDRDVEKHGCTHYRRRCKIVAPCCGEVFWCRHCHNAEKNDDEPDPKKKHQIDRKLVREVVCALCQLRQPVGPSCIQCGVGFGRFSCMICKFFDDDLKKQVFHCEKCGICRVGGRHNFFHCDTCNCCYSKNLQDQHVCIENSMHQNCPVCFEYLFDSIRPLGIMPCGHTIHQECLHQLTRHRTYTCPVCMKSILPADAMESLWRSMDEALVATPMPDEYKGIQVNILCNDCGSRSTTLFHVVGHKCGSCGSYNTRRV